MTVLTTLSQLFANIQPGTTVLTPNRRLAATLQRQYQATQLAEQKTCWQTPDVLPFITWVQRLWQGYISHNINTKPLHLLNPAQESYLWEEIITHSPLGETLLRATETADLTQSAWKLLREWRVDISQLNLAVSDDCIAMHTWATTFSQRCQQQHWLDNASVIAQLINQINKIDLPKKLLLVNFNELSPLQQHFLHCLEQQSIFVKSITLGQHNTGAKRISFAQADEELLIAACWAKQQFLTASETRIGCVIPNLATVRDRVADIFTQIFSDVTTDEIAFNVSAGKSLAQYPLIQTALQLLQLTKSLPLTTVSYLLASPFLGEGEWEYIQRAQYEAYLRKHNYNTISFRNLLATDNELIHRCTRLTKRLTAYFTYIDNLPSQQSFSAWAKGFTELLTILGWPGERSLNSEEYQIVEQWLNLFAIFASLDQVAAPPSYQQALHVLHRLAATTIFQPRTPEARVQVLGLLEAAGLPFDHLWITGLNDTTWPPQPNPNPFIPKKLQRELAMPHATALRELEYCQQLMHLFLHNAENIIVSHAEQQEDIELQMSPLIRQFPEITCAELALPMHINMSTLVYNSRQIEIIQDDIAPAINAEDTTQGGINILKQQALCPFKAFAEIRLFATELESPQPGLRAKDRGSIVHKSLELIWKQLGDQQTLCRLTEQELNNIIETAITTAITETATSQQQRHQYIRLEQERTKQLLYDWLQTEKQRPSFIVKQQESNATITLNRLTLTVRIDRIDQLSDGKDLIIDYKTNTNNEIYRWLGDRLEEPQLPLYSLLSTGNTIGISYAQLTPGQHEFKGISSYELNISGVTPISDTRKFFANSWEELISQWHTILTKLCDDFTMGIAIVDPKDPPTTCVWCALKPLCRIYEEINADG